MPPGATSSPSPSCRPPATRPRISCSSRASSPTTSRCWRSSPRGHRPLRRGRRLRRCRIATSTTPPRCAPTARCSARIASGCCRTTPCSTRRATSRRVDESDPLELYVIGGVKVGISICEDIWSPFGAARRAGGRRRRAEHQHQRLAVPLRQGRRARTDARDAGRRLRTARSSTSTRSAGRTSWSSTAARWCSTPKARCSPAATQFVEQLLIVDVPIPPVYRKRLLDPRGRRDRGRAAAGARVRRADRAERRRVGADSWPSRSSPIAELYDALVLGTRRLLPQERLHRRGDRAVGRDRLHDRRVHRGRRARRRSRARRVDAVALLERPLQVRRRAARREPRHRLPHDPDRAGVPGLSRHAGAVVRGPRAGPHVREPAEPVPRCRR